MKEIKLTNSEKVALVDDEDYPVFCRHRWMLQKIRTNNYAVTTVMNKNAYLHRLVMGSPNIGRQNRMIDHINHNGLDNRKCNLRWVTHSQNAQNKRSEAIKGLRGVFWDKGTNKWSASIGYNCKTIRLGAFENEKDAAKTYDKWALFLFGKDAAINFPAEQSA